MQKSGSNCGSSDSQISKDFGDRQWVGYVGLTRFSELGGVGFLGSKKCLFDY
jgi:hypothetical protein